MSTASICILITIVIYLAGMLAVGFYFARKNESTSDFYLGGRKLGPLVTAMSAEASDMSGYLLMGLPDSGGSGSWYIFELVVYGQTAAPLYTDYQLFYPPSVFFQSFP